MTERQLRTEQRRLVREIAALKAELSDALLGDGDTAPVRQNLRTAEQRNAEINRLLATLAEKMQGRAALSARRHAAEIINNIVTGVEAKLAALEPPAQA